jgi:hypothetical protein
MEVLDDRHILKPASSFFGQYRTDTAKSICSFLDPDVCAFAYLMQCRVQCAELNSIGMNDIL